MRLAKSKVVKFDHFIFIYGEIATIRLNPSISMGLDYSASFAACMML